MCDKCSDSGFPASVMKWYRLKEPGMHLSGGAGQAAFERSLPSLEEWEWKGSQGEREWGRFGELRVRRGEGTR